MELTKRKAKQLPWQSIGVLLMYQAGMDPRDHMALNTYYNHKRVLKSHGFVINPKLLKK